MPGKFFNPEQQEVIKQFVSEGGGLIQLPVANNPLVFDAESDPIEATAAIERAVRAL